MLLLLWGKPSLLQANIVLCRTCVHHHHSSTSWSVLIRQPAHTVCACMPEPPPPQPPPPRPAHPRAHTAQLIALGPSAHRQHQSVVGSSTTTQAQVEQQQPASQPTRGFTFRPLNHAWQQHSSTPPTPFGHQHIATRRPSTMPTACHEQPSRQTIPNTTYMLHTHTRLTSLGGACPKACRPSKFMHSEFSHAAGVALPGWLKGGRHPVGSTRSIRMAQAACVCTYTGTRHTLPHRHTPELGPPCHIYPGSAGTWSNSSHHQVVSGRFRCNMASWLRQPLTTRHREQVGHTHARVWKHASQPPVPTLLGHRQSRAQCAVCATTIQAPSTTIYHPGDACAHQLQAWPPPWHATPSELQKHPIK